MGRDAEQKRQGKDRILQNLQEYLQVEKGIRAGLMVVCKKEVFVSLLEEAVKTGGGIHFNLQEFSVVEAVADGMAGKPNDWKFHWTHWEFQQILLIERYFQLTQFYQWDGETFSLRDGHGKGENQWREEFLANTQGFASEQGEEYWEKFYCE